jgi:hypothetical protein
MADQQGRPAVEVVERDAADAQARLRRVARHVRSRRRYSIASPPSTMPDRG